MAAVVEATPAPEVDAPRKPMMSTRQILYMNAGFFGIQYSFGMQQTAINPIFGFLGADPHQLPILNLAGPITGLLIQPLIGALSDRTWSPRYGRRKPFFLIGAIGCSICLFLFPFVTALWMAVLLLWLLDASNNTAMEPYRAFLADKLPDSQLAKGFLTQSFFTGFGITLANLSLWVFQKIGSASTEAGIPYWVFGSFMLGAVCSIGAILVTVLSTKENPPTEAELAQLRAHREKGNAITDIVSAVRDMPASLHKLGLVYMFQWYAIVIYWQFASFSLVRSVFNSTEEDKGAYAEAVGLTALANATYNIVTFSTAFLLVGMARKYGAKWVHAACLCLAGAAMLLFPHVQNQWMVFVPMIGLGIAWASMMGVPYIMVVSMVPKERYGVYMGIINMMIVVPMLIQTITFGFILDNFLGGDPQNAITFAGVLFFVAALAMTWIRPPKRQSPVVPLTYRQIMGYGRVLVGSDGSPSSLRAVDRAAEVAAAAEAELMIVCSYNPMTARQEASLTLTSPGDTRRGQVRGEAAAREALSRSAEQVNTARVRLAEGIVVEGDPAQALVDTAVLNGADLIVVGNRGLGALAGTLLGSVPAEVSRAAACDVLIVQTGGDDAGGTSTAGASTPTPVAKVPEDGIVGRPAD
ncbi:MAG TPA: MFS transporter [Micromonosporaceae bacterium]|nr:MFS transporter [Micromonosporaceae bacterium]